MYASNVDLIVAENDKNQKGLRVLKNEHNGTFVSVDKVTWKTINPFHENKPVFITHSADLSHILGSS